MGRLLAQFRQQHMHLPRRSPGMTQSCSIEVTRARNKICNKLRGIHYTALDSIEAIRWNMQSIDILVYHFGMFHHAAIEHCHESPGASAVHDPTARKNQSSPHL
jgi:hypothetical protein